MLSTAWKVSGSSPGSSHLHAKTSSGKILNPELSVTVSMLYRYEACSIKHFECSSRVEKSRAVVQIMFYVSHVKPSNLFHTTMANLHTLSKAPQR